MGGRVNQRALVIAFQATPLQTFWPIVVGAIGLIESASYISDMKGTAEQGRYYAFNEQRGVPGDIGFDPLGFASKGDLRSEEVIVGRIAMLGIAGMVAQDSTRRATSSTRTRTKRAPPHHPFPL